MTSSLRYHDFIWKLNYRQGKSTDTFPCLILIRLIFMTIFIVFIFYISVFNWTHLFRINLYLNISNTKKNKPVYCVILSFSSELCTVVGAVYTSVFIQENIILNKKRTSLLSRCFLPCQFYSRRSSWKYHPPLAIVNDITDPNWALISSIGLQNIHAMYTTEICKYELYNNDLETLPCDSVKKTTWL